MLALWAVLFAGTSCDLQALRYEDDDTCRRWSVTLDEDDWIRVGGEIRQRLTFVEAFEFGEAFPEGAWLGSQRYFLHLDGRWAGRLQTFVQLGSMVAINQGAEPPPTERNDFDVLQAFIRWKGEVLQPWVGRRVLQLGGQRLVARREGPNVRRSFDGAGLGVALDGVRIESLIARPVAVGLGVFDDFERPDSAVWGTYVTLGRATGVDLYYLGYMNASGRFDGGREGREIRHSFGLRTFGEQGGFDWDVEAVLQVGDFDGREILAWTAASIAGYTMKQWWMSPRLGLSVNVASGEQTPGDGRVDAFNALFPRGNYFSEAAVLGPRNFYNLHVFVSASPLESVRITTDVNAYWRLSLADGIYGPSGNLIRGPNESEARFVTLAWSTAAEWEISWWLDATAIYTLQAPGAFISATEDAPLTHFIELTARVRL